MTVHCHTREIASTVITFNIWSRSSIDPDSLQSRLDARPTSSGDKYVLSGRGLMPLSQCGLCGSPAESLHGCAHDVDCSRVATFLPLHNVKVNVPDWIRHRTTSTPNAAIDRPVCRHLPSGASVKACVSAPKDAPCGM